MLQPCQPLSFDCSAGFVALMIGPIQLVHHQIRRVPPHQALMKEMQHLQCRLQSDAVYYPLQSYWMLALHQPFGCRLKGTGQLQKRPSEVAGFHFEVLVLAGQWATVAARLPLWRYLQVARSHPSRQQQSVQLKRMMRVAH